MDDVSCVINKWFTESYTHRSNLFRGQRSVGCHDKHPDCQMFTKHCVHEQFISICPQTCNACYSTSFGNTNQTACVDISTECGEIIESCNEDHLQETFKTYCQKTCKLCDSFTELLISNFELPDKHDETVTCTDKKRRCSDPENVKLNRCKRPSFRSRCEQTCNFCNNTTNAKLSKSDEVIFSACVDKANNCEDYKQYCMEESTLPYLKLKCAKTCGFCLAVSS